MQNTKKYCLTVKSTGKLGNITKFGVQKQLSHAKLLKYHY